MTTQRVGVLVLQKCRKWLEQKEVYCLSAENNEVAAVIPEGILLFGVNEEDDNNPALSIEGRWNRYFLTSGYRNAANLCNDWNTGHAVPGAYCSQIGMEDEDPVLILAGMNVPLQEKWNSSDTEFGEFLSEVVGSYISFFDFLQSKYPDPLIETGKGSVGGKHE